jgi:hypothetical protein
MLQSESVKNIAAALVKAQAKVEGALKDRSNPAFKSKYADLSSVMDACKDALNGEGIAIVQTHAPAEAGRLRLETRLHHTSGEWIAGLIDMPLAKQDPQGYGSATTYARRYGLASIIGVCPEDDDGNGASDTPRQQPAALAEGRNKLDL